MRVEEQSAIAEVERKQRRRFRIPAVGLLEAMKVTLRALLSRTVTVHYPEERLELPPRTRGVIALLEENCTVCMLCAKECPCWCIYIEGHKVQKPGKRKAVNELDRFAIDYGLCMYCGICVEVCPFDALHWSPNFEYTSFTYEGLVHEAGVLTAWEDVVLPPPELVDDADPSARNQAQQARGKREQGVAGVIREADKRDEFIEKQAMSQPAVYAPESVPAAPAPAPAPAAAPAPAPAAAPAPAPVAPAPTDARGVGPAPATGPAASLAGLPRIDPLNLPPGIDVVARGRLKKLGIFQERGLNPPADLVEKLKPILDEIAGATVDVSAAPASVPAPPPPASPPPPPVGRALEAEAQEAAAPEAAAAPPPADLGGVPRIDPNNLPPGIDAVARGRLKKLAVFQERGTAPPPGLLESLKPILDQLRGEGA